MGVDGNAQRTATTLRNAAIESFHLRIVGVRVTKNRVRHRRFYPLPENHAFLHSVSRVPGTV